MAARILIPLLSCGGTAAMVEAIGISEVVILLLSSMEQGDHEITADIAIRGTKAAAGKQSLMHQATAFFSQGC
jgi:hypothetical protein